tara:strand:+ start:305 stop:421 length:117 start_codon:yes stop_codon:yes gene_type:complete
MSPPGTGIIIKYKRLALLGIGEMPENEKKIRGTIPTRM